MVNGTEKTNYIPFRADLRLGIGQTFYNELGERYSQAMLLLPSVVYDMSLSSLEREVFSGALNRLEKFFGLKTYSAQEMSAFRNQIWGTGRTDQHREGLAFELASLLIINREVKDRYTLDRKLTAVLSVLENQKNSNRGFLSGRYGNLRLATVKVYKATYDNKFSVLNYNTINPQNIDAAVQEGLQVIGNKRAVIPEMKHAYGDFYFRASDAYRLLVANTTEDNQLKRDSLQFMSRYANLSRENVGTHEGAERLEKQATLADYYRGLETGRSWWNPFVWSRWGFDLQTEYHQKTTTSHTDYNYTINSYGVTSPTNTVDTKTVVNEFKLIGGLTYPFSNYVTARFGGSLTVSDYDSSIDKNPFIFNGTGFVPDTNPLHRSFSDQHGYQVTGYSADLNFNISLLKQRDPRYFLFVNNLSINPYFSYVNAEQRVSPEHQLLGNQDRTAYIYGASLGIDLSPTRATSDLFRWRTNLDFRFINDTVQGVNSQYSTPVWNPATLGFDLVDIHTSQTRNRNMFNFFGRTEFDFTGKNWLIGISGGLNIWPSYQYDPNMDPSRGSNYYDLLAGLRLGYQNTFRSGDNVYEWRLMANAEMGYLFGGEGSSQFGFRSAGLSLAIRPQISRVEFETGFRYDMSAPIHTSTANLGLTGSSRSETTSNYRDMNCYIKFTYRPRSWSTWLID